MNINLKKIYLNLTNSYKYYRTKIVNLTSRLKTQGLVFIICTTSFYTDFLFLIKFAKGFFYDILQSFNTFN